MSYHRRGQGRRAMSGLTSQAPGAPVFLRALSGSTSQAPGAPVSTYALSGAPAWYRKQGLGSLGDDTLDAQAQAQWRTEMLAGQRALIDAQKTWAAGDKNQKWIQIGVTAAIPLFAAIWRLLGIGARKST